MAWRHSVRHRAVAMAGFALVSVESCGRQASGRERTSLMSHKPELAISYDSNMRPVSSTCTGCGEVLPAPPLELTDSADIILWLSFQFLAHKAMRHSAPNLPEM